MFDTEDDDFIEQLAISVAMHLDTRGVRDDEDRQAFVDELYDALYNLAVEPYIVFGPTDD